MQLRVLEVAFGRHIVPRYTIDARAGVVTLLKSFDGLSELPLYNRAQLQGACPETSAAILHHAATLRRLVWDEIRPVDYSKAVDDTFEYEQPVAFSSFVNLGKLLPCAGMLNYLGICERPFTLVRASGPPLAMRREIQRDPWLID